MVIKKAEVSLQRFPECISSILTCGPPLKPFKMAKPTSSLSNSRQITRHFLSILQYELHKLSPQTFTTILLLPLPLLIVLLLLLRILVNIIILVTTSISEVFGNL